MVGSVIPGSTVILALSALVPGGDLRLEGVLAAAVAGALIGDGSAFWVGHRSQREILGTWPLSNYPRVIAQSEAFFHRWGVLAVFFARFVAPIRAFVPITAGALDMQPLRFYAVNIPAILLWALAHVLPGVLAVSAFHQYAGLPHHHGLGKLLWMLAVLVGAPILALAVWALRRRHGSRAIEASSQAGQTLELAEGNAASRRRTDIARARPDQPAVAQLLAGMRDPSDGARHGKQRQFVAGRETAAYARAPRARNRY